MRLILTLCASAIWTTPVLAQSWTATPEETEMFCQAAAFRLPPDDARLFCDVLRTDRADGQATLRKVDLALAEIAEPQEFDPILLTIRGTALAELGSDTAALKAFEQAMERYPDIPAVALSAIAVLAYTGTADRAADYWVRLAEVDPLVANLMEIEVLTEVVDRLRQSGDHERAGRLIRTLYIAGFAGSDPQSDSTFGQLVLDNAVGNRNLEEARIILREGRITNFQRLNSLASLDDYRPLWSEVGWLTAAARQDAVRRWATSIAALALEDPARSGEFLSAILPYVGPTSVIAAYDADLLKGLDSDGPNLTTYAFWLAPVANAHMIQGDFVRAEQIYQTAIAAFRASDDITRFNAGANYARMLVETGRHAEALEAIEPAIGGLARLDHVNPALGPMHAVRARALHGLGRLDDSDPSMAVVRGALDTDFNLVVNTLLSIGRLDEARRLVLESLLSTNNSRVGVTFLQRSIEAYPIPAAIERQRLIDVMRTDPEILAALAERGRIVEQEPVRLDGFALPKFNLDR